MKDRRARSGRQWVGGGGLLEEREERERQRRAKTFKRQTFTGIEPRGMDYKDRTGQSRPELDQTRELILVSRRRS